MFYFDKHDERVLFQDIREIETTLCDGRSFEIKPDIIADFTDMPYPDESFRMVVFDPPHLKYEDSEKKPTGWQFKKYGYIPRQGWQDYIRKGFSECFRVLQSGGFLIFKWNETDIRVSEILKLTPYKPILGHKSGKQSNTHWMLFMKPSKEEKVVDARVIEVGRITYPDHTQKHQHDLVQHEDGVCRTIIAGGHANTPHHLKTMVEFKNDNVMATKETKEKKTIELPEELRGKKFRIRKLTPRECYRLQDVDDEVIDKLLASGLSNSSHYFLAGNSITVNVLAEIFRKLFIYTLNENQQLSLW